jgi:hypothetical protein
MKMKGKIIPQADVTYANNRFFNLLCFLFL